MTEARITIFTTFKPFRGDIGRIQRKALTSWLALEPRPEVLVFGADDGVASVCAEFGLAHIPEVSTNEFATPLLSDLFEKAQKFAAHDLLCYVNGDIVLAGDLVGAAEAVTRVLSRPHWILTGRCIYMPAGASINLAARPTADATRAVALRTGGKLGPSDSTDYFLFLKGTLRRLQPFAVGRGYWHAWLLWHVVHRLKGSIIDATPTICAVHHHHVPGTRNPSEHSRNRILAGGWRQYYSSEQAEFMVFDERVERVRPRWMVQLEPWRRGLIDVSRPIRHILGRREETARMITDRVGATCRRIRKLKGTW